MRITPSARRLASCDTKTPRQKSLLFRTSKRKRGDRLRFSSSLGLSAQGWSEPIAAALGATPESGGTYTVQYWAQYMILVCTVPFRHPIPPILKRTWRLGFFWCSVNPASSAETVVLQRALQLPYQVRLMRSHVARRVCPIHYTILVDGTRTVHARHMPRWQGDQSV